MCDLHDFKVSYLNIIFKIEILENIVCYFYTVCIQFL